MKMKLSNEAVKNGFRLEEGIVIKYTIEGRKRRNWKNRRGYSRQFIKDNCEKCRINKNLTIHHIVPLFKRKDYSEKNCMTLCRICHNKIHKIKKNSYKMEKKKKIVKKVKEEEFSILIVEKDEWGSYRII